MRIWAQTLVKNEDRFLWYAAESVVDFVDKILLWDTGSTDKTLDIIDALALKYPEKVISKKLAGEFDEQALRQKMLDESECDWILVVDGDEVWWEGSIKNITGLIRSGVKNKYESIITPTINAVGDIFHFQEKEAGKYRFGGRIGHFALRAFDTGIPGLHSEGEHGVWGWVDNGGKMIQDRDQNKIKYVDAPYLHLTHLRRSSLDGDGLVTQKRKKKLKHELGIPFPLDYFYPEVFFRPVPDFVSSPWQIMSLGFKFRAFFETPLRKINRRLFPDKIGY